jgi:hypothetical protein
LWHDPGRHPIVFVSYQSDYEAGWKMGVRVALIGAPGDVIPALASTSGFISGRGVIVPAGSVD